MKFFVITYGGSEHIIEVEVKGGGCGLQQIHTVRQTEHWDAVFSEVVSSYYEIYDFTFCRFFVNFLTPIVIIDL